MFIVIINPTLYYFIYLNYLNIILIFIIIIIIIIIMIIIIMIKKFIFHFYSHQYQANFN